MRRAAEWLCLLSLASATASAHAEPAPERDAVVVNHGRRSVQEIYVSPGNVDEWGEERLGDHRIGPGESARVRLGHLRDCVFDMQAVYDDASQEERHGIDLCRTHSVTFDGSSVTRPVEAKGFDHRVTLANAAARPIQQVFVSPADSGDWGADLLANSLSVSDRAEVTYRGACVADLRVVFDNRGAEERRGLDLCAMGGVTIQPGWTTADALTVPPGAGGEPVKLTVVNHAAHAVRQLYLYPDGGGPGPDLLNSDVLADGGSITVEVKRPSGSCLFGAHVIYGGKLPDQDLAGVDICKGSTITLAPRS